MTIFTQTVKLLRKVADAYGIGLTLFLFLRRAKILRDKDIPPVAFLNSFMHLLMMSALPLVALVALWRNALRMGFYALPVLEFLRAYSGSLWRGLRPKTDLPPVDRTFTLLTFNIHGEGECLHPILDMIGEADADIVALQEVGHTAAKALESAFAHRYPYRALHPNDYRSAGQAVLSRFPICEDDYWRYVHVPRALGHQRSVIDLSGIGGELITLYNIHPVHPGMVDKFFDAAPRAIEIQELLGKMAGERGPILICGDMNMSDQSDDYRAITAVYHDGYKVAGRGMGYTFPDWDHAHARTVILSSYLHFLPPFLRLDYIFYSDPLHVYAVAPLHHGAGSDHRPVLGMLGFRG